MIVIGSYAAMLNGISLRTEFKDIDFLGSPADLDRFRLENAAHIESEERLHDHRVHFELRDAEGIKKLEFDIAQTPSSVMLADLAKGRGKFLNSDISFPSATLLYLIKRAHANTPVGFEKAVQDMLLLYPLTSAPTADETAFYIARKKENEDRFASARRRFYLSLNDDFAVSSGSTTAYARDDVYEAVAHEKGKPIYLRCRHPSKREIDTHLFNLLDLSDRLRMVQEEFMVVGIERNYVADRTLAAPEVYARGMMKTVKDLYVGDFQDFCLDNFSALQEPPPFDFLKRFDDGIANGEIEVVTQAAPPPGPKHKKALALIKEGKREDARVIAEDLARRSEPPGDPHAFHILGVLYSHGDRKDLAERYLRASLGIFEQNAAALTRLGIVLRLTGEMTEAQALLRRSATLNPNRIDTQVELGMVSEKLNNRDEARKAYSAALRIQPGLAIAVQRLAGLGMSSSTADSTL